MDHVTVYYENPGDGIWRSGLKEVLTSRLLDLGLSLILIVVARMAPKGTKRSPPKSVSREPLLCAG
jgi:hypothetical protein